MTPFKFTPEDFKTESTPYHMIFGTKDGISFNEMYVIEMARLANALLALWLKDAVRVYGQVYNHGAKGLKYKNFTDNNCQDNIINEFRDTHTALLIDIKEIEKMKCESHVPKLKSNQPVGIPDTKDYFAAALMLGCSIVCAKCGVDLKVEKWSEL